MTGLAIRGAFGALAILALTACSVEREHVLAPDARGVVVDAETLEPVSGAVVRFNGLSGALAASSDDSGRFALEGRTEMRHVMPVTVGGVYRDASALRAEAAGFETGHASAAFINGLGPAQAEHRVIVVLIRPGAPEPDLVRLMADCLETPEQRHAAHIAARLGQLDRETVPDWLDTDAALGLEEHISIVLQPSLLLGCEHTDAAHETLETYLSVLRTLARRTE